MTSPRSSTEHFSESPQSKAQAVLCAWNSPGRSSGKDSVNGTLEHRGWGRKESNAWVLEGVPNSFPSTHAFLLANYRRLMPSHYVSKYFYRVKSVFSELTKETASSQVFSGRTEHIYYSVYINLTFT